MTVVAVLVVLSIICVFAGIHWFLWRRMVRDVSAPGSTYRRIGTVLSVALPVTSVAALVSARSGLPLKVQQIFAWPGYFWIALMQYLAMALLAGELLRPLLRWWLGRRAAAATGSGGGDGREAALGGAETERPAATVKAVPALVPDRGASADSAAGGRTPAADEAPRAAHTSGDPVGRALERAAPSRRLFVSRTVAVTAGAVAAGTVGLGAYSLFNGPTVKRVTVPLAKLPRSAHGFRIAVVSDIHIGPILGRAHTQRIVDAINGTQPDLVAIVGDLVDGSVEDLGPAAEPLARLRSRHGSYFVTGNHEYYSGADAWVDQVRDMGVHPLRNAREELPGFDLAGVNDISGEEHDDAPDYDKALGDRDPARASVLMAHQPVQIHEAVDHGVDLQLSGHTHGGQMWPGNYLAALANPTVAGLERYGDTQLYVTRGAGAWGPPVRVGAESDITVVELASGRT